VKGTGRKGRGVKGAEEGKRGLMGGEWWGLEGGMRTLGRGKWIAERRSERRGGKGFAGPMSNCFLYVTECSRRQTVNVYRPCVF